MNLPPIPLHASTQMDNRTPEQVAWLRSLGFAQVVLARELSIEQIRAIHQEVPDVPLEAFVHGALCVSYSGQCYASQYCFRRSANRGECAQPCRKKYSLLDKDGNRVPKTMQYRQDYNNNVIHNWFPTRKQGRDFFYTLYTKNPELYDNVLNIHFRSDILIRNYEGHESTYEERHKDQKKEFK